MKTGDAGFFDEKTGHLKIIDRAKDVGKLNDGTLFPPKYIENKLKFFPNIREAVAFGDRRDFVAVMLNIDLTAVGSWAERNNVVYGSYQELAGHPQVYDMIAEHVAEVNRDLAADKVMAGAQIHRFLILHKELDADDGELTRTQKVRRGFIAERYAALIEALYDGSDGGRHRDRGHLRGRPQGRRSRRAWGSATSMDAAAGRRTSGRRRMNAGGVESARRTPRRRPATCCSRSRTSRSSFGGVKRSATSPSTSARAKSAPSSARTAPARPRCSTSSTASTIRRKAASPSRARRAPRCAPTRRPTAASPAPSRTSRCSTA